MFHSPVHRLFFAIRPPITIARQITNAAYWFGETGDGLRPEHLHVTLDILDDVAALDHDLTRRLVDIGEAVSAAPFRITLDRVAGGERSIALRPRRQIAGLDALRREIARHRAGAGIAERARYQFSPHLTLGYRDGRPFNDAIAPVEWEVRDFLLIHSHVGRTRHDLLGRWSLQGAESRQLALL